MAFGHGCTDLLGALAVGQMQQQDVAGGALDERADSRAPGLADDEVSLPMAGDRAIGDLGRPLADHDHVDDSPVGLGSGPRPPLGPPGPQAAAQLASQFASPLNEQGLVDRLVRHMHHRITRIHPAQPASDLLG
jgi:hypothetical protein